MEKKAIKVFVSKETHEVLKQVQQKLKDETGKKTSLAEILNNFTEQGIDYIQKTQNFESTIDTIEVKTQNNSKSATKIQKKYEKKLEKIEIRESTLRENETELFSEREKHYENQKSLFIERDELAGLRFALAEKDSLIEFLKKQAIRNNGTGLNQEIATEHQQELLSELNELKTIAHQQNENRNELFDRTQESLKHYFELLMKNTNNEESKLMKFLPLAISGFTAFMVKNSSSENKKEIQELKEFSKAIKGSYNSTPN